MNSPAPAVFARARHPPGFRARRGLNWGFLGLLYTSFYLCRYNLSIANKSISDEFGFSRADMGVIITTALIPGRPAPRLVTSEMVASMKPGSVVVDLAVERGGNVEGAKAGEVADVGGIKIVGYTNVAGRVAASASSLYARNLFAFIETLVDKSTKALAVKWDDELVKATALTKDGAVIHPNFQPKA